MDTSIRADLDTLPAYVPGRTVPGAIKLASNEVALPPPRPVLDAIIEAASAGNRYPDMAVTKLIDRLAERHGVSTDQVATGCGSVSLCHQMVQITCGADDDEVMFAWRSFESYPIATRVGRARPVLVPLDAEFRHDLDAMAAAITPNTRLVFLCSPNNPTGPAMRRGELEAFLDAVPANVVVVLDEAYREFVTDPEVPDGATLLPGRPNLVVLRTFSKAYRLAGLRVGYALAAPPVAAALRKVQVAFSVNAVAQAAAMAALDCLPELLASCADVVAERTRVLSELSSAGYRVPDTQANFVWLPLGERASEFAAHCEQQKVIIRPFAGDGVRVTVADADANDAFLAAARSFPGVANF
jgi:histidinol-phosphate aminotransferase